MSVHFILHINFFYPKTESRITRVKEIEMQNLICHFCFTALHKQNSIFLVFCLFSFKTRPGKKLTALSIFLLIFSCCSKHKLFFEHLFVHSDEIHSCYC